MPANDLALLIDAVHASGKIATPFWRNSPKAWDKNDDAGPVTEADLAVDEMLKDRLLTARPDYGWLSEETEDDTARLSNDRVFIVDPIDGTRSFIAGDPTWAHSIAVAEHGKIIAAAVFLPIRDKLYTARTDGGAFLNGAPIQAAQRPNINGATVLAAKRFLDQQYWVGETPPIERHFRSSLAYRLSLVAEGRFDAMLTFRDTWEWDVAAGTLIVTEAGANVTDKNGATPRFNNPRPAIPGFLAGGHAIHNDLRSRVADI